MKLGLWFRVALLAWALPACASHSERVQAMRTALDAGQPEQALAHVNEQLDVKTEKDMPESAAGDNAIHLLDRSMILQMLARYELSSRDLQMADKQIDLLDLSRNAAHDIGKYLFSDSTGPYKAPAYEKLLVNATNMMNYLARNDLNGARIEARRLAVMQKYLGEHKDVSRTLLGPGTYLAGFTFEKSGRADEALRYYDEALTSGTYPSLALPVARLMTQSGYSTPRLAALAASAPQQPLVEGEGEILVIIGYGRVPEKIAKRVPIGLALTYASAFISPAKAQQANQLAAQGLVTWVNYPELSPVRIKYDRPQFFVNGQASALETPIGIDDEARRAWDEAKGAVMASAITRMIARVVAGEIGRAHV